MCDPFAGVSKCNQGADSPANSEARHSSPQDESCLRHSPPSLSPSGATPLRALSRTQAARHQRRAANSTASPMRSATVLSSALSHGHHLCRTCALGCQELRKKASQHSREERDERVCHCFRSPTAVFSPFLFCRFSWLLGFHAGCSGFTRWDLQRTRTSTSAPAHHWFLSPGAGLWREQCSRAGSCSTDMWLSAVACARRPLFLLLLPGEA